MIPHIKNNYSVSTTVRFEFSNIGLLILFFLIVYILSTSSAVYDAVFSLSAYDKMINKFNNNVKMNAKSFHRIT